MKKKILLNILLIITLILGTNTVSAVERVCTRDSAEQLAKIVFHEVGGTSAKNSAENLFQELTVAGVALNNAYNKSGNTTYEKLLNLTDNNYQGYSTYKNNSFSSEVPQEKQGELLYVAELVLTNKYNLPSNMTLQASEEIVTTYGTVWTSVVNPGFSDVYFGYEGSVLKTTTIFGEKLTSIQPEYFRELAKSYKKTTYNITSDTVCEERTSSVPNNNDTSSTKNNSSGAAGICTNPDILRVIYFGKLIVDIVKIIIPIGLIIMGMIDLSKSVVTNDDGVQKKNMKLFIKRIIYAVLVFAVPWIVEVLIVNLGNLAKGVNYTDCLENANSECIENLENGFNCDGSVIMPSGTGGTGGGSGGTHDRENLID